MTDGPRILFLHGLLSGGLAWRGVREELGDSVSTIAPDLLGYGSALRPRAHFLLQDVVEALVPVVERERPTHVVGHSMGAIVALALAGHLPGAFERVGLIGIPVFHDRADGLAFLGRRRLRRVFLHTDHVSHYGCEAMQRLRPIWMPFAPAFVPGQPPEALAAAFDHCRSGHVTSLDEIVFAGRVASLAAAVTAPVAALHGRRDGAAPLSRVREVAATHAWDLKVAPTGNHQLFVERPRQTARWVRGHVLRAGETGESTTAAG